MALPVLSDDERAALETLAATGPERALDRALRGRLALYKLIDETPAGWKITALGRELLSTAHPRREAASAAGRSASEEASPRTDGERHYGRKSRDTSWLD